MIWKRRKREEQYIQFYEADDYQEYQDHDNPSFVDPNFEPVEKLASWKAWAISALFVYVLLLIVGYVSTPYVMDENGKRRPELMNVQMRQERIYYERLYGEFLNARDLLQEIRPLDDQLKNTKEGELFVLATRYQALLEYIDSRLPLARGTRVSAKYNPIKKQIETVYEDASVYLQKISASLVSKDPTQYEEGVTWRAQLIEDFDLLSENMYYFGRLVLIEDEPVTNPLTETKPILVTPEQTNKREKEHDPIVVEKEPKEEEPNWQPIHEEDVLKPKEPAPVVIDERNRKWGG